MDIGAIREDFPALQALTDGASAPGRSLVYLDNAATTQRPRQVLDTLVAVYTTYNANVHRSSHLLARMASDLYEQARESVARFINARESREIVFTRNATEALNLVAGSLARTGSGPLQLLPGDEIIVTLMEHHSNLVPWQALCAEVGLLLKVVGITSCGVLDREHLDRLLGPRTRLVCCTHVSNVLGTINSIAEIADAVHRTGALLLVDGAQSVPSMPVDVQALGCDFLAFSGHKMLAPFGVGVLYGREELLSRMSPFLYGGDMIDTVTVNRSTWNALPWKFEAGTPDVAAVVCLGGATDVRSGRRLIGAVDYLRTVGMQNVRVHEGALLQRLVSGIEGVRGARVYGPPDPNLRSGVVSFYIAGVDPFLATTLFDQEGICVRAGGHCAYPLTAHLGVEATIRVSPYLYTTTDEIDRFLSVLEWIVRDLII